eukprot:gene13425-14805_t
MAVIGHHTYGKVTLYLCSRKDLGLYKQEEIEADEADDTPDDDLNDFLNSDDNGFGVEIQDWGDTCVPIVQSELSAVPKESPQEVFIKCPTCRIHFPERDISQHAEICAETAHIATFSQLFAEIGVPQEIQPDPLSEDEDAANSAENTVPCAVPDQMAILKSLAHNLKSQVRINVRHGRLFVDYVEARKRCSWILPENKLKVVFIGGPAIDTGGPRQEFLTEVLKEVEERLFEDGIPTVNSSAIADHEFELSGNLMVASLLQGRQSPCLLKEWVYRIIVSGLADEHIPVEEISSESMATLYKKEVEVHGKAPWLLSNWRVTGDHCRPLNNGNILQRYWQTHSHFVSFGGFRKSRKSQQGKSLPQQADHYS